jgi:tRNA-2-methylthio-N6-dimethylallyladenosine synthase
MMNQLFTKNTIYIETYGCQMNVYDTELVRAILRDAGYSFVNEELDADVILLNTCAIRENAHRKIYGRIHEIRHHHREAVASGAPKHHRQPFSPKIGILGCMATNLRSELLENRALNIDFIAGPDSYKRLPSLIEESFNEEANDSSIPPKKRYDLTLSEFETYSEIYPARESGVNAWIAVMRGCNNFCSFCVVPYTRGRERSRSIDNVTREAERLVSEGFQQITLLGQNVNSYHHEGNDFADLMSAISQIDGIKRIRFTSPHPKDFPEKFLEVMRNNAKICRQIHLPLQSGSDRILDQMNRTYTRAEFMNLVKTIRAMLPDVALSTDVIVGFCGETDQDFEDTMEIMRAVEFDSAFTFKYSERKNTIASRKYPDDVPETIKTERIVRLVELQKDISLRKNQEHVGKKFTALIEKSASTKSDALRVGRLDNNKLVIIDNAHQRQVGEWVNVFINRATPHDLHGTVI